MIPTPKISRPCFKSPTTPNQKHHIHGAFLPKLSCQSLSDEILIESDPVESLVLEVVSVGLFWELAIPAHLKKIDLTRDCHKDFIVSISTFSKGLLIFAADLRASRHSDWYCISRFDEVITKRFDTFKLLVISAYVMFLLSNYQYFRHFSESFLDLSSACSSDSYWQYFNELLYSGTGYPAPNV